MKRKKSSVERECIDLLVQVASGESTKVVAERLRHAGHDVESELPISGLIGVRCTSGDLTEIGQIRGVDFVKVSGRIQLPPFDGSVAQ